MSISRVTVITVVLLMWFSPARNTSDHPSSMHRCRCFYHDKDSARQRLLWRRAYTIHIKSTRSSYAIYMGTCTETRFTYVAEWAFVHISPPPAKKKAAAEVGGSRVHCRHVRQESLTTTCSQGPSPPVGERCHHPHPPLNPHPHP